MGAVQPGLSGEEKRQADLRLIERAAFVVNDVQFINTTANYRIYNSTDTYINPWLGSVWQQATTALGITDQNC